MTLADISLMGARARLPLLGPPNVSCGNQAVRTKVQERSFKGIGGQGRQYLCCVMQKNL